MKVGSNEFLSQKCDSNKINDLDVTYMNKLNKTLNANVDLVNTSTTNACVVKEIGNLDTVQLTTKDSENAVIDSCDALRDSGKVNLKVDEISSNCENVATELNDFNGKGDGELTNLCRSNSDSGLESTASSWDKSVTEIKEHAFIKLEEELQHAREILKLRDEEVSRLRKMRQDGDNELLELTASLFEEAHNMVNDANVRRLAAEKALKESLMKVEVLTAEVTALKTLILSLTPNKPSFLSQTQVDSKMKDCIPSPSNGIIFRKHHSSLSCSDLQYGRENMYVEMVSRPAGAESESRYETDPNFHREFLKWKENPNLEQNNPFIIRIYREDIDQCLDFNNSALVSELKQAIDSENIFIEAVDKAKAVFPKKCALMEVPRLCHYRMKISDSDKWLYISQMCRNRIISVCNFLNYLRYIQRGLVKSSEDDVFWEVVRLRKEMMLAKLGLPSALPSR